MNVIAEIPKTLTHILSPLDLTVNRSLKRFEKDACVEYYSSQVAAQFAPGSEVEDIRVDTRLSILKPLHAKTVTNAYKWLKTDAGVRNVIKGWEAAGQCC